MKVDDREIELIEFLEDLDVEITVGRLSVADVVIGCYPIEIKNYKDFTASILDGRMQQFIRLTRLDEKAKPILLIIGFDTLDEYRKLAITTIAKLVNTGMQVIMLRSKEECVRFLIELASNNKIDEDFVGKKIKGPAFETLLRSVTKVGKKQAKTIITKHDDYFSFIDYIRANEILNPLEKRIKNYLEAAHGFNKKVNNEKETYYLIIEKGVRVKEALENPKLVKKFFAGETNKLKSKEYAKQNKLRSIKVLI